MPRPGPLCHSKKNKPRVRLGFAHLTHSLPQQHKMPPRIARSSVGSTSKAAKSRPNARNPKKAQRRAMNAFSIAQYENPEEVKISKNRLGQIDPAFNRKRTRDDDDDDDEEGEEDDEDGPKRRKRAG